MTSSELERRLMSCFTAGDLALEAFLRISRIELTDSVPTAAIECAGRPRLFLNPAFINSHCDTDERLFMLVLHEIHHVLLGHTRLFPRPTPAHNLAFDAVINAVLCQRFPHQRFRALFEGSYSAERLPELFLRPPQGWPEAPVWRDPLHEALYTPAGVTYDELLHKIAARCAGLPVPLLLGNHGQDRDVATDPLLREAVRRIVETWPMPRAPIRGRSAGSELTDLFLGRRPAVPKTVQILRAAMRRLLVGSGAHAQRGLEECEVASLAAVPNLRDRRAMVSRELGDEPLVYQSSTSRRKWSISQKAAHVYLDISGSTTPWHDGLASALEPFVRRRQVVLHAFSEQVIEVSLADLRRGKLQSTQGTNIGCVADHIVRHSVPCALLVTDGYVGSLPRQRLQGTRIHVALTPGGFRDDLALVCSEFFQLPETP